MDVTEARWFAHDLTDDGIVGTVRVTDGKWVDAVAAAIVEFDPNHGGDVSVDVTVNPDDEAKSSYWYGAFWAGQLSVVMAGTNGTRRETSFRDSLGCRVF